MKLVTFDAKGQERLGAVDAKRGILDLKQASSALPGDIISFIEGGDGTLAEARKVVSAAQDKGHFLPLAGTKLYAPIPHPRKNIFCIGRNYKLHIEEGARARGVPPSYPKIPEIFSKPFTTVIGPEDGVKRHANHTKMLDYEVEFAVVIGKKVVDLTVDNALAAVFGYTVFNDVTARDAQRDHGQWFKGKSFDTFGPMGPCIVTKDEFGDWSGKRISLKVNGEIRQDSNTSDLLFGVPQILASLSASLTLHPGDV
ncbi:MAG TPA: fumarylacetoacetate hydrolase family protein, partial [Alphaproteobacteria bacterium]|nr:fumarylacetoacetate hydrolase family protein [Alphaproteobacteria bacterium]